MKFLVTLKQKDLSAVSVEQLYKATILSDISPIGIDKYDLYTISGDFDKKNAIKTIENSYIFFNPNKHHLIMDKAISSLSNNSLYINITRKEPLALNAKMIQFKKSCPSNNLLITKSDLWEFKYTKQTKLNALDLDTLTNELVISSESNTALFAHPLIHDTQWYTADALAKWFSHIT